MESELPILPKGVYQNTIENLKKGSYTVLNVEAAEKGVREEIWHGWNYAKTHQSEFELNKETILKAVDAQLCASRIFIAPVEGKRKRERIEAAIMHHIYTSKDPWSELADRGMFLKERYNSEMPIEAKNICAAKIYGLPEFLEF